MHNTGYLTHTSFNIVKKTIIACYIIFTLLVSSPWSWSKQKIYLFHVYWGKCHKVMWDQSRGGSKGKTQSQTASNEGRHHPQYQDVCVKVRGWGSWREDSSCRSLNHMGNRTWETKISREQQGPKNLPLIWSQGQRFFPERRHPHFSSVALQMTEKSVAVRTNFENCCFSLSQGYMWSQRSEKEDQSLLPST